MGGASYINNAGASFPLPAMSTPYPGMSIPYPGMSIPYPGMSISNGSTFSPTMTLPPNMAPTGSNMDLQRDDNADGSCIGRGSSAGTQIHVQLDVDSLSDATTFLDVLAQSIVSFGELHFSLCPKSGNQRRLLDPVVSEEQYNATVTGLDATASAASGSEVCTSAEQGAYCTVVDVVFTVYSATEDSSSAAEQQVYDEVLVNQLEAGTFVNGDIIAIRFHTKQDYPTDSSAVSRDGNQQAPTEVPQDSSSVRTIIISVLVIVAVAVLVGLVFRKRMAKRRGSSDAGGDDDSKCDATSITGEHGATPVLAAGNGPHSV